MADGYSTVIDARATSDRKWIMKAVLTNTSGLNAVLSIGGSPYPLPPTEDGVYTLQATVANGAVTYSDWTSTPL